MSDIPNSFDELLKIYLRKCEEAETLRSSLTHYRERSIRYEADLKSARDTTDKAIRSRNILEESFNKQVANLQAQVANLQVKAEQDWEMIKSRNIIEESLRQQVASLKKQLEDAKQDVNRMGAVINKQASDEKDLQKRLEGARADIATRDQTISRQFEEIGRLKWELGAYRVEAATHDQTRELTRKNEELEKTCTHWMAIVEEKDCSISKLISECDELRENLRVTEATSRRLADMNENQDITIRSLKEEIERWCGLCTGQLEKIRDLEAIHVKWLDQCPPVQKLATQGPSITRPAETPAIDKWITFDPLDAYRRHMVTGLETINGRTRIICGGVSINAGEMTYTGPTDRGPWRKIGELR